MLACVLLYVQGWVVARKFDPEAIRVMERFVGKGLEGGFTAASTIRIPLAEGVTAQDAAHAMGERAAAHGMGAVERLTLQEEDSLRLEIIAFLPPDIPPLLLGEDWALATHIPYRVVLYWDGVRGWLAAMDPGLFVHGLRSTDPELKSRMVLAKDRLLDIMAAGANGD